MITLKINSVFKNHFDQSEYQVDVSSYYDIEFYLKSIHPRFRNYIRQIKIGEAEESFTYVNSNLEIIDKDTFALKKVKDGEVIYLVPVIVGGGGSKGFFVVAAFAVIAIGTGGFGLFTAPALTTGIGAAGFPVATGFSVGAGGGIVGGTTGIGFVGSGGGLLASFASLPSLARSLLGNLALNLVTSLFTSKPQGKTQEVTKDSGSRSQNNMFGNLVNSTTSGTPVGVNYGLFRLGGQFLSGYVLSAQHDKDNAPTIESYFTPASTPLASDVGTNT